MNKFERLGMSKQLLDVVNEAGFEEPTEMQEKTIPLVLSGRDVIGGSATGSGKTLAFATSIIDKLKPNKHVQALILTPTRELAEQVATSIRNFSKFSRLNILSVYGGVDIEPQMRKLAVADVVVGTPGRLLDHMQRGTLRLDEVKFLVLDEVDRMFDMGFREDVEKILVQCPKNRQTMLFSATISPDINYLAKKYTKDAVEVSVKSYIDPSKLKQVYYDVENYQKFSLLVHLLKNEKSDLVMVFCSTRRNADFVAKNLNRVGVAAKAIHGGLSQNQRNNVLSDFHGKGVGVLVCTDVAARGLDIKDVSHVYNYDLPKTSDEYIHRIGRTARAGEEGKAINLLSNRDYENFTSVQKDANLKIAREELPRFENIPVSLDSERRGYRERGGRSNSGSGRSFGRGRSGEGFQGGRSNSGSGRSFGGRGRDRDDEGDGDGGDRRYSRSGGSGRSNSRGGRSFGRRSDGRSDNRRSQGSRPSRTNHTGRSGMWGRR